MRTTLSLVLLILVLAMTGGWYWLSQDFEVEPGGIPDAVSEGEVQAAMFSATEQELSTQRKEVVDELAAVEADRLGAEEDEAVEDEELLTIRVVDDRGEPVVNAMALTDFMSDPTDDQGLVEIYLPIEDDSFWVGAEGYAVQGVERPADMAAMHEVVLEEVVHLTITWILPEGTDMNFLKLMVDSEGAVFTSGFRGPQQQVERRFRKEFGLEDRGGSHSGRTGKTRKEWKLFPRQEGMNLWDLKPGVAMEVKLVGPLQGSLATSGAITLTPGERRVLELRVDFPQRELWGRVVDTHGKPLEGANVIIYQHPDRQRGLGATTSADGEFRFEGMAVEWIDLDISMDGYGTLVHTGYPVRSSEEPPEFVMEPARSVVLRFVDPNGTPVIGGSIWRKGKSSWGILTEDGGLRLEAVPQQSFEVLWKVGVMEGMAQVPGLVEEFHLEVPEMGSALVQISRKETQETRKYRALFAPITVDGADAETHRSLRMSIDEIEGSLHLPSLLPGTYSVQWQVWEANGIWEWQTLQDLGHHEVVAGGELVVLVDF